MSGSTIGRSIREFRKKSKLTADELSERLGISKATLGRIERGDATLGANRATLIQMGWVEPMYDDAPKQESSKAAAAIAKMRELLDAGRPRAEIYEEAQRVLASLLDQGLTNDEHRGWNSFLKSLTDGMKEEGRLVPLHKHPEWQRCIDIVLRAILPWPDALRAVQEEMRRLG